MGVSGSGKTTIARGVADRFGWELLEGDTFHPAANIEKMTKGIPLDDDDRRPWLEAIAAAVDEHLAAGKSIVVACSALKRSYRDILIGPRKDVALVYLKGTHALIGDRMGQRKGHFMPPSLLASQFTTLEEPAPDEKAITVLVEPPAEEVVAEVLKKLQEQGWLA